MNTLFKCDGAAMDSIKTNLVQAQSYLNQAYTDALKLQKEIESKEDWTGKSELVAEGFLDILVQYQKDFYGVENPQSKAIIALNELDTNLDNFFSTWEDYLALEGKTL